VTDATALQTPPAGVDYPGKTLGIVAVIVAIFFSLIGLILGVVARNQSKQAGYKNTPATAAIIIGAIFLVIGIISTIAFIALAGSIAATSGSTY
jgi:hypothetical protein